MTVATPNQVNLQVRIAEVNVTKLNEIGVNWSEGRLDDISFLTTNPVTIVAETTNTLIAGHTTGTAANADRSDALAQEGLITSLAEPNLTAMSGQTASFLAGGEFPVPISGASAATGGFPTISVEFKDFGVSLDFTPTIIDANHLNLRVRPEVSELSTDGEVSVPLTSTATVTIPALTVRRAETTVELASGESFALAGLLHAHHPAAHLQGPVDRRYPDPRRGCFARTTSSATRPNSSSSSPPISSTVSDARSRPRPTASCCRTMRNGCYSATNTARGCPRPARGPLDAGGKGLIGPGGFRLD